MSQEQDKSSAAGDVIDGRFVLEAMLGQGGIGMVLKAVYRRMDRIVAIKIVSPKALASPDLLQRFQREVWAAAKLNHPNIVTAYDADEADVRVIRGPLSAPVVYRASLEGLAAGEATDVELTRGDVVYVTTEWLASFGEVLQRLSPLLGVATVAGLSR